MEQSEFETSMSMLLQMHEPDRTDKRGSHAFDESHACYLLLLVDGGEEPRLGGSPLLRGHTELEELGDGSGEAERVWSVHGIAMRCMSDGLLLEEHVLVIGVGLCVLLEDLIGDKNVIGTTEEAHISIHELESCVFVLTEAS